MFNYETLEKNKEFLSPQQQQKSNQNQSYYPRRVMKKGRKLNYKSPEEIENLINEKKQNQEEINTPFQVVSPKIKFENSEVHKNVYPSTFNYMSFTEKIDEIKQSENQPSQKVDFKKFKIQDFELGKKLGKGRFGEVYLAREKKKDYIVALKILKKSEVKKLSAEKQLVREINIHSFVQHPNIIELYGFFHDDKNIYLILEYAPDGDLYKELKNSPDQKLAEQQVSQIIDQILDIFIYLQKHNIIHRDLKPENILLSMGEIKLADFGWSVSDGLKRKTFCGTVDYVPPEMVKGNQYDLKSDNWAIGILCYELLVGKPPFEQSNQYGTLQNIKNGKIVYPNFLSQEAKQFIKNLLQNDSQQRIDLIDAKKCSFITKFKQFEIQNIFKFQNLQ